MCGLNELHCVPLCKLHFTRLRGQADINLTRLGLTNWTAAMRAIDLYPPSIPLKSCLSQPRCQSVALKRKVPYSLLASGFFRRVHTRWRRLRMDWGTRLLVFTTVIDRWDLEGCFQPSWCHLAALVAPWWAIRAPIFLAPSARLLVSSVYSYVTVHTWLLKCTTVLL